MSASRLVRSPGAAFLEEPVELGGTTALRRDTLALSKLRKIRSPAVSARSAERRGAGRPRREGRGSRTCAAVAGRPKVHTSGGHAAPRRSAAVSTTERVLRTRALLAVRGAQTKLARKCAQRQPHRLPGRCLRQRCRRPTAVQGTFSTGSTVAETRSHTMPAASQTSRHRAPLNASSAPARPEPEAPAGSDELAGLVGPASLWVSAPVDSSACQATSTLPHDPGPGRGPGVCGFAHNLAAMSVNRRGPPSAMSSTSRPRAPCGLDRCW